MSVLSSAMCPGRRAIPIVALLITAALGAAAQEEGFDPFAEGAFEAAAAQSVAEPGSPAAPAEVARAEYLVGGLASVRSDATLAGEGYGGDPSVGRGTGWLGSASLSGKLFAKASIPDRGSLYIAYNLSYSYFQGAGGDIPAPSAQDPYAARFALSELHYSFDLAKAVFLRAGSQLVSWGPSRIWSPVDFINKERKDAFSSFDARSGKPGLRIHVPLRRANLFAFADFGALSEDGRYGDPLKAANLGGRLDFTAANFEFGLSAYGGAEAQLRAGADFSGRLFGSTVYGEFAAAPGYGDFGSYAQAALGFSRSLGQLKDWSLSAEGFYNSTGRDLSGYTAATIMALPSSERTPLYQGEWYAYAALRADELLGPELGATASGLANLSDLSYQAKLQLDFAAPRAVPFSLSLSYSGGGSDKEFTRYSGDGAVAASLSARMEF